MERRDKMKKRLSLNDVEWDKFWLEEIVTIESGVRLIQADQTPGNTPFIGSSDSNNGVTAFVSNHNNSLDSNVLGVNYNGSVVENFYHPYKCLFSDDVKRIHWKERSKGNKYTYLFLKTMILQQKIKYAYGYKFNAKRMKRQKILLPVNEYRLPNYQFMENYIKQEQKEIAQKIIDFYEHKILETGFDLVGLEDVKWKVFSFSEIFRKIQRGKRLKKDDHIEGNVPYVSSTSLNNGVDGFIGNEKNIRKFNDNLTLANSGSVGSCFYHQYEYVASDHVTALTLEHADKYIYLFMATIIKRLEEKYSFNREINDKRIKSEKLILPVDENGNPYWEYMSQFMQKIEAEKLGKTLEYIYIYKLAISRELEAIPLREKKWREFFIGGKDGLFKISSTKSGIDKNKLNLDTGTIPYITRSDMNNGINLFITSYQHPKYSINKGNVITIGLDTQTVFYQMNDFFTGQNIQVLENENLNKYNSLFIVPLLKTQMEKFNWGGNGATLTRLNRTKILLPTDENRNPDWQYMKRFIQIETIKQSYELIRYYENLVW